jgi:hypothetical protein
LSVLKLMRLLLDDFPSVDLPSLKFLHLESVTYSIFCMTALTMQSICSYMWYVSIYLSVSSIYYD